MQTEPTMLAIGFQLTNGKLDEYQASPVAITRVYHTATIKDAVAMLDFGYLVCVDATDQAALDTIRNHAKTQKPEPKGCMHRMGLTAISYWWSRSIL